MSDQSRVVTFTPEQVAKLLAEYVAKTGAIQLNELVETDNGKKFRVVVQQLTF